MSKARQIARDHDLPPIEELVLQRGEMLLLERLIEAGTEHVVAKVRILPPDHPLLDPARGLPVWVGIELMAQAVAAYSGLDQRAQGRPPRIGLLLGTRAFDAHVPFIAQGSPLTVKAQLTWRDDGGLGVFACELRDGQRLLASAQVKGYIPEDIREHLGDTFNG